MEETKEKNIVIARIDDELCASSLSGSTTPA
jgi:hypothetical protein